MRNIEYNTIVKVLKERALNQPDSKAYIFIADGEFKEETITYGELDKMARSKAAYLQKFVSKGDRVLMFYPTGLEFVATLYACFYAGIIAVPAYPPRKNRSLARIHSIVTNCEAKILLTTQPILKDLERNFSGDEILKGLPRLATDSLDSDESTSFTDIYVPSESIAMLQYTSGSTGNPKGVMVSHRSMMANLKLIKTCCEIDKDSILVHWLPIFHDMGLIWGVIEPLFVGCLGILIPPVAFIQKPIRWLEVISRYKATLAGAPNFAYDLLVNKTTPEERSKLDLSNLKTLYNGAEPIRKSTLENFIDAYSDFKFIAEKFYPTYGMAEAVLVLSGGRVQDKPVYLEVNAEALEQNRIIPVIDNKDSKSLVSIGHPWLEWQDC